MPRIQTARTVQTVLGPVDAVALGRTLMHEHVFVLTADVQQNYPQEWGDEDARVDDAVRRLSQLPQHGIDTIVDVTVIGQGRSIPRVKRIAERVRGLNIVVATGCYTFGEVPLFFSRRSKSTMTEFFIRDITEGIAGTGVKAGMLKCAVDEKGLTQGVEQVLRSVAQAHARTRTPITIHTHAAGQHGPAILKVFEEEGADLDRVVLGPSRSGPRWSPSSAAGDSPDGWSSLAPVNPHSQRLRDVCGTAIRTSHSNLSGPRAPPEAAEQQLRRPLRRSRRSCTRPLRTRQLPAGG
jgi:hypothetical protein